MSYYTVKKRAEHEIDIQKSRFIAHIARVETEDEAKGFIEKISKSHWKANHNCYAYVIGPNQQIQKASDDGEPTGTAGVPILEVLKKKNLRDTAVVVTRYFGGIKLGAGGLIRAYSKAASEGLKASGLVKRSLMNVLRCTIDYTQLGTIENEIRQSDFLLKEILYEEKVSLIMYVLPEYESNLIEFLTNLTSGTATISQLGEEILEEPERGGQAP